MRIILNYPENVPYLNAEHLDRVLTRHQKDGVRMCKGNFINMVRYAHADARLVTDNIKTIVSAGIATWDQLGFTSDDLEKRAREILLKEIKGMYAALEPDRCLSLEHGGQQNVKKIRTLVEFGIVTWEELGFTDDDLREAIRQMELRDARQHFSWITEYHARQIHIHIDIGTYTWEELGFTEGDLRKRLWEEKQKDKARREACIAEACQLFESLSDPDVSPEKKESSARCIRELAGCAYIRWDELPFIDAQVTERLDVARQVELQS